MSVKNDQWNPQQYNRFKDQRAKPFHDLVEMIQPGNFESVIDLGCGTGELTRDLHTKISAKRTLGLDSSTKMLEDCRQFSSPGLDFKLGDISSFEPTEKFDLVFSNAALQWLPEHESLLAKIFSWIRPGGQIAVPMPYNHDHPSHRLAREIATQKFPGIFTEDSTRPHLLSLEKYAELLFQNGFSEQESLIRVYDHPMTSGRDVIEWTKGTTLTAYQKKLTAEQFQDFLSEYSAKLLAEIGTSSYFYTFKRLLFWGRRSS